MTYQLDDIVNKILCGDALTELSKIPDKCVHTCVTSPPYFGLRDYGHPDQLGQEATPELYIQKLVEIFSQVKRVLRDDGTLWVNIGDSYAREGGSGKDLNRHWDGRNKNPTTGHDRFAKDLGLKPKDLIGIPWMLAFALRADGWYLRQDIIWNKNNPMPESVTDRCTKTHEYIFLLSKSPKYYFDQEAIKEPVKDATIARLAQNIENQKGSSRVPGKTNGNMKAAIGKPKKRKGNEHEIESSKMAIHGKGVKGHSGYFDKDGNLIGGGKANKKSVWTVNTQPFKKAHFATYPVKLIAPCILAGCPQDGIVLDPFGGSGTTGVAAREYGRNFILIELNNNYIKDIANPRVLPHVLSNKIF